MDAEKAREQGIGFVHQELNLSEAVSVAENVFLGRRATILRDGEYVGTRTIAETNIDEIIKLMVGRELNQMYPKEKIPIGEAALEVKGLEGGNGFVKPANFYARRGEIVGFSGLVGSGRTELMRLLFGADIPERGEIVPAS